MNDPLKKYRRRFRFWQNSRRLKREQLFYQKKFRKMNLTVPGDDELRRQLREAFPRLTSKPKGQLRSIAIYHHYNWENYSLRPALAKFGPVRHYDWFEDFSLQDKKRQKKNKALMNKALVEKIRTWMAEEPADVIFMYVSGEWVEPDSLLALRSFGVPMINLALNDKEHFVGKVRSGRAFGARDICRCFDLCWTSTQDALVKYCVEGARPIYLPEGANPDIHKPYPLEKTIDVSFVGQCYGNRAAVIQELIRHGIEVTVYGFGWPNGPLAIDEMVKLYSRSRINLGFGGVEGHPETFCLKGRDFEIPMSGGLYLTEDHPELHRFFKVGEEILTYSGTQDLIQKIRRYLAHPEEAEAIRKKGYERSLKEHTWENRFSKVFHLLGILQP
jgi:spore maturation protein CgeB